jgi:hypothetical protein
MAACSCAIRFPEINPERSTQKIEILSFFIGNNFRLVEFGHL